MRPNIHTELEQLPVEVLTRYLSGGLSNDETVAVEEFLKENPMYADALEGLREMPDTSSTSVATHQLRHKTRGLLKKRVPGARIKQFNFVQYATAAVAVLVVLFIASTALFFNPGAESNAAPTASATEKSTQHLENAPSDVLADGDNKTLADAKFDDEITDDIAIETEEATPTPESVSAPPAPKATPKTAELASQSGSAASPSAVTISIPDGNATDSDTYSVPVSVNINNKPDLTEAQLKTYKDAVTEKEYAEQIASAERDQIRQEESKRKDKSTSEDDNLDDLGYSDSKASEDFGSDESVAETTKEDALIAQKEIQSVPVTASAPSRKFENAGQVLSGTASGVEVKGSRNNKKPQRAKDKKAASQIPVLFSLPADSVSASLSQAIAYYNNEQYTETVNILQQVLATSPDNYQAKYYMGNSYQNMNQPALAVPYLKKVVAESDSSLFEVARWNLAHAYLQSKNTRQAKKLLRAMIEDESAYKEEAEKKLKEL